MAISERDFAPIRADLIAKGVSRPAVEALKALLVSASASPDAGLFLAKSANLSDVANAATSRTNLGLQIGVDVQAYDPGLLSIAAASTVGLYYLSAADTWSPVTIGTGLSFVGGTLSAPAGGVTSFNTRTGAVVLLAADVTGVGGLLNTAIGVTVQAWDADLDALAALSSTGLVARTGAGTVAARTLTGPAAGISVSNGSGVSGNPTLALANDLAALEGLSGTNTIYYRSGADTWSAVTIGSGIGFSGGTLSATGSGGTVTSVSLSGPLGGGTVTTTGTLGTSSYTAHGVLLGNGSSALTVTAAPTDGQLLIGKTSNDPVLATLTAGTGIIVTNGAGSISIAATGATIPSSGLFAPQGRLSLVTGTAVPSSDQTAKTHVYYTPYVGATVPIYDGSSWGLQALSADLDMALDATNHPIENVYDLFVWNNTGTVSIGAGPSWSNTATITVTIATPAVVTWTGHTLYEGAPVIFTTSGALPTGITAGTTYYVGKSPGANTFNIATSSANAAAGTYVNTSGSQSGTHTGTNHTAGARGTGAGTTELQMLNGIWTNKNAITLTNGAGAGTSVPANRATYVGSIYTTANGQTGVSVTPAAATGGNLNFIGVYNAYNRVRVRPMSRDSTADWNYSTATWRAANASVSNRINWLDGLRQTHVSATYEVSIYTLTATKAAWTAIGLDTTANVPQTASQVVLPFGGANQTIATVADTFQPQLGLHYINAMEAAEGSVVHFLGAATSPTKQLNALIADLEY